MNSILQRKEKKKKNDPKIHMKSCHGLDLKCPPKANTLKAQVLSCGAIGRWWNL
jgi:hypothetical protein